MSIVSELIRKLDEAIKSQEGHDPFPSLADAIIREYGSLLKKGMEIADCLNYTQAHWCNPTPQQKADYARIKREIFEEQEGMNESE